MDSPNPYEARVPGSTTLPVPKLENAQAIRESHIDHEAVIRSIGYLHILSGILIGIASLLLLWRTVDELVSSPSNDRYVSNAKTMIPLCTLGCSLAIFQILAGFRCRSIHSKARVSITILAAFSLCVVPVGTILGTYTYYLLYSSKGEAIFSKDYQFVIKETPNIKPRFSLLAWPLIATMLGLVALNVAYPLLF